MTILGVDLGTTNSLAVVYKDEKPVLIPNAYGEYVTPSAVSILDGKIVVGKLAKERLLRIQNVVHLCLSEIWAQMLLIH